MSGLLNPKAGNITVLKEVPFRRHPILLQEIFLITEEIDLPSIKIARYVKNTKLLYPRFDEKRLKKILSEFELSYDMKLNNISYGQKKKFIIAFALSTNCKLLLFDEPTNGLDIPSKSLFRKIVAGAVTEEQTVFISTHQVRDIENLIDQVLIINHGQVKLNKSLFEISKKYNFVLTTHKNLPDIIYQEDVPGGYKTIIPAQEEETEVDLETLFNAVLKEKITC